MKVLVIGAGWTGSTVANILNENGVEVLIIEKEAIVGGHSSSSRINGVVWEPYGAHIFHTSNDIVAKFVNKHGLRRKYEHKVITQIKDKGEDKYLSWPPQIDELKKLSKWKKIQNEIEALPAEPVGQKFVDYVISMMGKTLYELFIEGYSIKQWGDELENLSSSFAPKRIELRNDGYKRLFRDKYEFFHPVGVTPIIESIIGKIDVALEKEVSINNIYDYLTKFDHVVLTCPLDVFLGSDELKWRGIRLEPQYDSHEDVNSFNTKNYVINYPSLEVPYVRTIETKHATGQKIKGTVVAYEYTGTADRHYPIATTNNTYENINKLLKKEINSKLDGKALFAGRLANYTYINQDQAILEGFDVARKILSRNI
jgi:UDP-galactopyranose mutase